jgi:glycosyltransferase involved in cell wall biosynthesis
MRILLACEGDAETRDSWSGVSLSLVTHLRAAGHSVRCVDVDVRGATRALLALRTASRSRRRWWVRFHLGPRGFAARSRRFARTLAGLEGTYDVILQVGATFEAPEGTRAPIVLFCDSNIELSRSGIAGFSEASVLSAGEIAEIRAREARVYARSALLFTMSEMLRRSFMSAFGIRGERLVTVHCGPNLDPDAVPARPDPRTGPPTVLFVGRDPVRKGADLLLSAFASVRARIPDARLLLVGPPRNGTDQPGVEYTGYLDRDTAAGRAAMEAAYARAGVFCLPTRFDPFGTSFVEAMVHGIPCVGPDAWAVPEIIEHERTGLLVPPGDPRAIADALVRLLQDHGLRARLGAAARARAIERFAWPVLIERMERALGAVIGATR